MYGDLISNGRHTVMHFPVLQCVCVRHIRGLQLWAFACIKNQHWPTNHNKCYINTRWESWVQWSTMLFGKLLQKASLSLAWQHGDSLALKHTKRHVRKQKAKEKLAAEDNLWDFYFLTEVMMNLTS